MFAKFIEESNLENYICRSKNKDIDIEWKVISELWADAIKHSFKKITPRRKTISGISHSVRELMREERWVRDNIPSNPERGRRISAIQKRIKNEIEMNRSEEALTKVSGIMQAKNPQSEIFKIRRQRKKIARIGFPLKDKNGNIQVSKNGIDRVVVDHFDKV